ncbi:MAG: hypothetical protein WC856_02690 [Methylococcaceae bacterium]|jgi:hypothetical protein
MQHENLSSGTTTGRKEHQRYSYPKYRLPAEKRQDVDAACKAVKRIENQAYRDRLKAIKSTLIGPPKPIKKRPKKALAVKKTKTKFNKTGFAGVDFRDDMSGKYRSRIMIDGQQQTLGFFNTPKQAHKAYCKAVKNKQRLG